MSDDQPKRSEEEQRQSTGALETLPLLTRTVFLLAKQDDFSYPEICEFRRKRAGYSDAKRATIPTVKWATVPT